jgi:hypothetical protein
LAAFEGQYARTRQMVPRNFDEAVKRIDCRIFLHRLRELMPGIRLVSDFGEWTHL